MPCPSMAFQIFHHQNTMQNKLITNQNFIWTSRHQLTSSREQGVGVFDSRAILNFQAFYLQIQKMVCYSEAKSLTSPVSQPSVLCPQPQHRSAHCSPRPDSNGLNRNKSLPCGFQKRPRHHPHLQPQNLLILFLSFFKICFFLIVGKLLQNVTLVSAIQQQELVLIIYIFLPALAFLPSSHLTPLGCHKVSG